jgi:hypothetical protein
VRDCWILSTLHLDEEERERCCRLVFLRNNTAFHATFLKTLLVRKLTDRSMASDAGHLDIGSSVPFDDRSSVVLRFRSFTYG